MNAEPSAYLFSRPSKFALTEAFTLIELSIVLVIIGLIVGGILVGQDLIRAAQVRATITQFEKFNTAVNTFQGKYGYLPGDIKDPDASNFGFAARGTLAGQGDGNGVLAGNASGVVNPHVQSVGEDPMVWVDLSTARLIEGNFTAANFVITPAINYSGSGFDLWFPAAKLGNGNYFIAQSGDGSAGFPYNSNFFSLVVPTSILAGDSHLYAQAGLTVSQAYAIDTKVDDGFPQKGRVVAGGAFLTAGGDFWAAGGGNGGAFPYNNAPASSTSCYDNGNNVNNTMNYSITQNGGAGVNCALSFRFQ